MSVTKDGDTGRWMSQIRVTDWTGKTIHKKKRGFATKKEALQWERDFISQSTGSLGMTFGDFIALYGMSRIWSTASSPPPLPARNG